MKFTFKFPISTLFKYKPQKFNFGLEQEIRLKLNSLPSVTKIYTNPDGSPRVPTDEEFKTIAELQNLYYKRNYSEWNWILPGIPKDQLQLFKDNSQDLTHLDLFPKIQVKSLIKFL